MYARISLMLALTIAVRFAGAQELPAFQIKAYGVHEGGNVVYHYRVNNNTPPNTAAARNASRIEIGRRDFHLHDEPELTSRPLRDAGKPRIAAPAGWRGYVSGLEDHPLNTIAWETTTDLSGPPGPDPLALQAGQVLTGLSVTVPHMDSTYLTSHFNVFVWSPFHTIKTEQETVVSGVIEPEDTTPPLLRVSVNPARLKAKKAGTLVPVTVSITATDDYDPAPEIRLESITANEPLAAEDVAGADLGTDDRQFELRDVSVAKGSTGRLYTITYSATDGSGNKATASATVTVK